jgi:hypothetical protein
MNQNYENMLLHLGRLSDIIFALAMALTIFRCSQSKSYPPKSSYFQVFFPEQISYNKL